jgi:hypothetical protein
MRFKEIDRKGGLIKSRSQSRNLRRSLVLGDAYLSQFNTALDNPGMVCNISSTRSKMASLAWSWKHSDSSTTSRFDSGDEQCVEDSVGDIIASEFNKHTKDRPLRHTRRKARKCKASTSTPNHACMLACCCRQRFAAPTHWQPSQTLPTQTAHFSTRRSVPVCTTSQVRPGSQPNLHHRTSDAERIQPNDVIQLVHLYIEQVVNGGRRTSYVVHSWYTFVMHYTFPY